MTTNNRKEGTGRPVSLGGSDDTAIIKARV